MRIILCVTLHAWVCVLCVTLHAWVCVLCADHPAARRIAALLLNGPLIKVGYKLTCLRAVRALSPSAFDR